MSKINFRYKICGKNVNNTKHRDYGEKYFIFQKI